MERDTHRRFREDPSAVQQLIDSFYIEVKGSVPKALRDTSGFTDERLEVHFAEYRMWALKNPQALAFFGSVPTKLRELINAEGRRNRGPEANADPQPGPTASPAATLSLSPSRARIGSPI